jgi:hypothetical protein
MRDAFEAVRISVVNRNYNNLPENKNIEINAVGFMDRFIKSRSGVLLSIVLLLEQSVRLFLKLRPAVFVEDIFGFKSIVVKKTDAFWGGL